MFRSVHDLTPLIGEILEIEQINDFLSRLTRLSEVNPHALPGLAATGAEFINNHLSKNNMDDFLLVQYQQLVTLRELMAFLATGRGIEVVNPSQLWGLMASKYALLHVGKDHWSNELCVIIEIKKHLVNIGAAVFQVELFNSGYDPAPQFMVNGWTLRPLAPPFKNVQQVEDAELTTAQQFSTNQEWRKTRLPTVVVLPSGSVE